ncbi:MAG: two-component system, OmpR family, sensor histidine kinase SenX3 [Frankiaceae bacterium]|nr:two-component system, OmpR family, sensor histidine kinase SenX3 [Frankiaceae bacterium]
MNVGWTAEPSRFATSSAAYDSVMSVLAATLIGLFIGLLVGGIGARVLSGGPGTAVTDDLPARADLRQADHGALREEVLDRAPIAVLALDSSDDVLIANRRARELLLVDRRGAAEPLRDLARLARSADTELTREITLPALGLQGVVIQARVRASPLPNRLVALIVEDVTEAHRVDVVRRDFVANVSHEIKTPVGALRLLAEAALESLGDPDSDESTRHFVERIARESARLGRLVSELLDLSRLQGAEARPAPQPVRLDDVIAEAVDRAAPHADAKDITVVRGEPSGAVVPGVEPQLVTAVANLLDNAINYSPDGTKVAVAARRRETTWELTVSDQGVGIPEGDIDRIFERFYRVDPARSRATGGTGLGLAIVKHIVLNHGGEIRVWSSPGAGSTFTLCLPLSPTSGGIADDHLPAVAGSTTENPHAPQNDASSTTTGGERVTPQRSWSRAAAGSRSSRRDR